MNLPTEQQCLDYFTEYEVPQNIFKHCCKVRKVAVFLAERLQDKKIPIDVEFVSCLGYFHDLCKMVVIKDFGKNEFHKDAAITQEQAIFWAEMRKKYPQHYEGEMAYEIFKDLYPELALSLKKISSPKNETPSWEELVVHYADLRVLREQVVLVSERLAYLRQRYPRSDEIWKSHEQKVRQLEQKIFSQLSFHPDDLTVEIGKNKNKENHLMMQHGQ